MILFGPAIRTRLAVALPKPRHAGTAALEIIYMGAVAYYTKRGQKIVMMVMAICKRCTRITGSALLVHVSLALLENIALAASILPLHAQLRHGPLNAHPNAKRANAPPEVSIQTIDQHVIKLSSLPKIAKYATSVRFQAAYQTTRAKRDHAPSLIQGSLLLRVVSAWTACNAI